MELDDIAVPLANAWTAEQFQQRCEESKQELNQQINATYNEGAGNGLPPRIKVFMDDVKKSATSDGVEIGQFVGFSSSVLIGLRETMQLLVAANGDTSLEAAYKSLVQESDDLKTICKEKVAMNEGDDSTSEFVTRERLEAHRARLMDFLRKHLPTSVRPPLSKLPPFMSQKLIPDSENFQW